MMMMENGDVGDNEDDDNDDDEKDDDEKDDDDDEVLVLDLKEKTNFINISPLPQIFVSGFYYYSNDR